jgi:two-component system sensor histidine kinase DesK
VVQAVDAERLRFARDLHDVLGHTLCAIALKGEVARTVLHSQPERTERELREILSLARRAEREIREVVSGYRAVSLAAELAGACAVLRAADIVSTVDGFESGAVPASLVAPLGYALREGATNVLRHAAATWCRIALGAENGGWVLRMANDGATPDGSTGGNGLRGLRERLAAVGGWLRCGPLAAGRYELVVYVPFPGQEQT